MNAPSSKPALKTLGLIDLDDIDLLRELEEEFGVRLMEPNHPDLKTCETAGQLFEIVRSSLPMSQQDEAALWPRYLEVVRRVSGAKPMQVSRETLILGAGTPWLGLAVIAVLTALIVFVLWSKSI